MHTCSRGRGITLVAIRVLAVSAFLLLTPGIPHSKGAGDTVALFFDKPKAFTTPQELSRMAKHNVLVFGASAKQLVALRAADPSLSILTYEGASGTNTSAPDYGYLDQHESWWVHDDSGSRMHDLAGPAATWLLHLGKDAFQAYQRDKIVGEVSAGYDGVFLDSSHPGWVQYRLWYDENDHLTAPPATVLSGWPDWVVTFHRAVKSKMLEQTQIFNTWPTTPGRYVEFAPWLEKILAVVDGVQFDGFCYNRTQVWDLVKWEYQVNQAARIVAMPKITLLKAPMDGLRSNPTVLERLQGLCFGSYLLVADGQYALFRNVDEEDVGYWNGKLFTAPIGTPVGSYYQTGVLYRRDFSNGTVIVNPTTSKRTLPLERTYYTLNAEAVTSVTLPSLSGVVLLLAPP